jgi:glutaredoxin 3
MAVRRPLAVLVSCSASRREHPLPRRTPRQPIITIKNSIHLILPMAITLYQFENCPYCAKVRSVLESLDFPYEKVEMVRDREDPKRKLLAGKSGVLTVPVIEIDGKFIGESDRIIAHLQGMKGKGHTLG